MRLVQALKMQAGGRTRIKGMSYLFWLLAMSSVVIACIWQKDEDALPES